MKEKVKRVGQDLALASILATGWLMETTGITALSDNEKALNERKYRLTMSSFALGATVLFLIRRRL